MRIFQSKLNNRTKIYLLIALLYAILIGGTLGIANQNFNLVPTPAADYKGNGDDKINLLYLTDYENYELEQALILDPIFELTKNRTDNLLNLNLSLFDSIVLEDPLLNTVQTSAIVNFANNGGSILVIMGPRIENNPDILLQLNLIKNKTIRSIDTDGIMRKSSKQYPNHPIVKHIVWNEAPETDNMSIVYAADNAKVLVTSAYALSSSNENLLGVSLKSPAIIENNNSNALLIAPWLVGNSSLNGERYNLQLKKWFYFNYLFYCSLMELNGRESKTYASWQYSPVPHLLEQIIIGIIEVSIIAIAIVSFTISYKRSKSKSQEEYLREYAEKMKEQAKLIEEKKRKEELERIKQTHEAWEQIGTHRQLSGFLFGLFGSIILMIPQAILTGFVFARYIMPYPFVSGMYDNAKQLFLAIWVLFDLGTSVALAKFFAQYRIEQPERAIRYIQIFIWFQTLTGCVQTAFVGFLGSIYFPHTHLASYSWLFILNSFIQFPGWFMVLIFVFQGMQRTDIQLIMNIIQVAVFDLLGKYLFIIIFRQIFSTIPQYGDAFGALVGYAIGQWLGEFLTFLVSIKIYKNLGFHMGTIFRVDFGKEEMIEVIRFGWKYVMGAALVPLVHMIQAYLLSIWIFNYNAEWGYYSQVLMLTQIAAVVNLYSQGIMAGISEAHSHDMKKLLELNIIQGMKISYYMSFFLNFALLIILPPFIVGVMGPNWESGVQYVPFLIFRALFEPLTWMGDKIFQGTGYTKEMSISWVVEQGSRLFFLFLLMNPALMNMQMYGLLGAWTISLILKVVYQIWMIRKRICKFHWYPWKIFLGNLFAALVTMILTLIVREILLNTMGLNVISGFIIFAIGLLGFIPVYSFISGLLGAWDDNTIREFDKASDMVEIVRPMARMVYKTAEWGSKRSLFGLFNKFKIDIYEDAMKEAQILTEKKKQLIL